MQDVLTVDRLEVLVVVDDATDSALTHQNCYPVLTCCLTQLATRRIVRRGQNNVARQISMTTRKELVEALQVRYRSAAFSDRIKILDEFVY